ncbi:DUF2878 family protein [Litorivicinus lipolyticus]|uniref:DUF2878 family protein n=1 Tax=Litorivicinus lipolyticus TaxID=418701 RepID=A0A5Q2Q7B1_9GAMM|nr:DUF2878 domain-containing protein [Litorivicinus lipolyticus]QGG80319.1 DUF2878 family protein [Litorivicinus lipolyticus]
MPSFSRAQLYNLVGFNLLWLLLITQRSPWADGVGLAWIGAHFVWFAHPGEPRRVALVMLTGVVIDGLLRRAGVFQFSENAPWLPAWLMLMWGCYATTLEHSLRWLVRQTRLAIVLGCVAGPLSYAAGMRLGAVEFPMGLWTTLVLLSVIWATLMGSLSWLYRRNGWV